MKSNFTLVLLLGLLLSPVLSFAQSSPITIDADDNSYSVHVSLTPSSLFFPYGNSSCQYGYNYEVVIDYEISFSGSAPSSLYTMQGEIDCGTSPSRSGTDLFFQLPNSPDTGDVKAARAWTTWTDCASATPFSAGCNSITIQIQGPDLNTRYVAYTPTPLPVEMTHLYINTESGLADLTWGTASEKDNDYFEIQRSLNGTDWDAIGRVEGNGTTLVGAQYSFTDPNPLPGVSYYRLKQVDFDGTFDFSEILVSKLGANADLPTRIYPNPTKDKVTVEGVTLTENIQVLNAVGQNITGEISLNNSGRNVEIDLTNLPFGIYFIQTTNETYRINKH